MVFGAGVTATSSTGFTATTNLAGNTINWNVLANSTTTFGKVGSLANIAIGDIVAFFGKVSGTGGNLTVQAAAVKDRTFNQLHRMNVSGTVLSTSITGNSLVVTEKNGQQQTILLGSGAVIVKGGATTTLSAVAVGDQVKAQGTLNTGTNVFTATKLTIPAVKEHKDDNGKDGNKDNKQGNSGLHLGQWFRAFAKFDKNH